MIGGRRGEGEGGQKQRTKKKGSAYNSYFHLAYYKNYTVDFQKRCEQNGLASYKKMVEWYNKRLDKGILDFTVSADSDETVRACVMDRLSFILRNYL